MKIMAIKYSFVLLKFFLASLLLISLSSAIEFSFSAPDSADLNAEFSVSITAQASDIYDVKIIVQDSAGKTLSQIYNDGWKSSYYYVAGAFPEKTEFKLKVISYSASAEICARLRKLNSSSASPAQCKPFQILSQKNDSENQENNTEDIENNAIDEDEKEQENPKNLSKAPDFIPSNQPNQANSEQEAGKIILTTSSNKNSFISKDETIKNIMLCSFILILILIIIFLAFKKL